MKAEDIAYWICIVLMYLTIFYGWLLRYKTKKVIKNIQDISDKRSQSYVDFVNKVQKDYTDFTDQYAERQNALSKENNKLREQNEMMKERLRNLGIKDFDVI